MGDLVLHGPLDVGKLPVESRGAGTLATSGVLPCLAGIGLRRVCFTSGKRIGLVLELEIVAGAPGRPVQLQLRVVQLDASSGFALLGRGKIARGLLLPRPDFRGSRSRPVALFLGGLCNLGQLVAVGVATRQQEEDDR